MINDFWSSAGGLLKFESYSDLVENLYQNALVDSFNRLQIAKDINSFNENTIRNHLAYDLENNNPILAPYFQLKILKLTKENTLLLSPFDTKRTDIEFFISGYGDYVVECKSLNSAEQRYINEGINRFTSEFYSSNDTEAGMIGFIVGGDINSIITNLLSKVGKDATYISISPPSPNCFNYLYSFHSTHKRITKTNIYIHHLFINLC